MITHHKRLFLKPVLFLTLIRFFVSTSYLNAFSANDSEFNVVVYREIKDECYHFIYNIHRNLPILEWPDSLVKDILKMHLEDYLIKHLNTSESRTLYSKYEAMDWDIQEMMKMHHSCNE